MRKPSLLSLLSLLFLVALPAAADPTPGEALRQLFDTAWQDTLQESPEMATYIGAPGHNDRWSDLSPAGLDRRRDRVRKLLQAAQAIDRGRLADSDKINLDLFIRRLERQIEGFRFPDDLLVIDPLGGIQENLPITFEAAPAATAHDFDDQIARLKALPVLVDQTIALLEKGLASGVTPPKITLRNVPGQVRGLLADDPLQSPLLVAFRQIPSTVPPDDRVRVTREALRAYQESAAPALRKLERYLSETYIPGARETTALSALPDGADWYAYNVRQSTTTDLTPDQIHELGLAEVKRIRAEMDKVIASTGFKGTFDEFLHFLRTDPQFFYDKPEDLVNAYRVIAKRADPELAHLFGKLPRLPYGVEPVPDYDAKTRTAAYYNSGSLAAGRPGIYFVNTYDVKSRPKWEMEPLTLHESVPGHHLQISLAQELTDLPEWRKYDNYPAFAEGWGLYAESLGEEMGFYRDPYSKFGQLTYEIWRALRLVVDTCLHVKGWTREQALAYARANSPRTEREIEVEIDRYIVNPGGAVAYKIGELKIKELRAYAEKELGAKFDLRAFHDEVLGHGSLPLDVLEKNVKAWVERQKQK